MSTTNSAAAPVIVTSTAQLAPDRILGYAKGIAFAAGGIIAGVLQAFPIDEPLLGYLQGASVLCGLIAGIAVPNAVKPVAVINPPAVVVTQPPTTVLGVVPPPVTTRLVPEEEDPPGRHEKTDTTGSIPDHDDTGDDPGAAPPMPGSDPAGAS